MIKGLFNGISALFASGLITNPMVLLGIVSGIYFTKAYPYEKIFAIYTDRHFYFICILIAYTYIFFFKRPYKYGGKKIDYSELMLRILGASAKLIMACILTSSFIVVMFF